MVLDLSRRLTIGGGFRPVGLGTGPTAARGPPPAALTAGAAALVVNVVTRTGAPLCRPGGLLQGHAAWHILTAIAIASWFAPARPRHADRPMHERGASRP